MAISYKYFLKGHDFASLWACSAIQVQQVAEQGIMFVWGGIVDSD